MDKHDEWSTYDSLKRMRRSWGDFNPTTRVVQNKKIYNRQKFKTYEEVYEDDEDSILDDEYEE